MKASHLSELVKHLKPCPFCGGQAALESANKVHWRVRCKSDYCGGTNWVQFEPDKACDVWNMRGLANTENHPYNHTITTL